MRNLVLFFFSGLLASCSLFSITNDDIVYPPPAPPDTTYLRVMVGRWQVISSSSEYIDSLGESKAFFYLDTTEYKADLVFERPDTFYIDVKQGHEDSVLESLLQSSGKFALTRNFFSIRLDSYDHRGDYVYGYNWKLNISSPDSTHLILEDNINLSPTVFPYVKQIYRSIELSKRQ